MVVCHGIQVWNSMKSAVPIKRFSPRRCQRVRQNRCPSGIKSRTHLSRRELVPKRSLPLHCEQWLMDLPPTRQGVCVAMSPVIKMMEMNPWGYLDRNRLWTMTMMVVFERLGIQELILLMFKTWRRRSQKNVFLSRGNSKSRTLMLKSFRTKIRPPNKATLSSRPKSIVPSKLSKLLAQMLPTHAPKPMPPMHVLNPSLAS
mmetsp:Transcript_30401/g.55127  ORF Transcript_30401/g.55127 Transcript_30401/m.55127 type:complete len:201 (-) Transcript_30401:1362-1964(-)